MTEDMPIITALKDEELPPVATVFLAMRSSNITDDGSGLIQTTRETTSIRSFNSIRRCPPGDICDQYHSNVSCVILTFGLIAFLENILLVLAMNTWSLKKSCKMYWFLWHLSLADAILAVIFIYFHTRILSSCPIPFNCRPTYADETSAMGVGFYGTILASHLFVFSATVDRFIAIKWSLRYATLMSTNVARASATAIWSMSFVIPTIGVLGIKFFNKEDSKYALIVVTSSICLLCAAFVIGMNIWMVVFACTSLRRVPSSHQARRESNSARNSEFIQDRFKLAVTLAMFVCSFVLSCAPWSVALILCGGGMECDIKREEDYTLVMVLFHGIAIPILYGFRVKAVKTCVVDFWKACLSKLTCRNENEYFR